MLGISELLLCMDQSQEKMSNMSIDGTTTGEIDNLIGDSNGIEGGENGPGKPLDPKEALSQLFDDTFVKLIDLIDSDQEIVMCCTKFQNLIRTNIDILKELTRRVTALQIFYQGDNYNDLLSRSSKVGREKTNEINSKGLEPQAERCVKTEPINRNYGLQSPLSNDIEETSHTEIKVNIEETFAPSDDDVKYLLIPALLGFLYMKIKDYDRLKILDLAIIYFQNFLVRCHKYNLCESGMMLPQEKLSFKGVDDYKKHMTSQEKWRQKIEKLDDILCKIKEWYLLGTCHDRNAKKNETSHEPFTSEEEKHKLNMCALNIEVPDPDTVEDFQTFVLYKYGRDYLKAKIMLDKRNEEQKDLPEDILESEGNMNTMRHVSVSSENRLPGYGRKMSEPQSKYYGDHTSFADSLRNDIGKKCNALLNDRYSEYGVSNGDSPIVHVHEYQAEDNAFQSYAELDRLIPRPELSTSIVQLFIHKCLNEREICMVESTMLKSLHEGSCFQPFYLNRLKQVPDWVEDDDFFVPVLMQ